MRTRPRKGGRALLGAVLLGLWPGHAWAAATDLPPVPERELLPRAPSPDFDVGLVAGVCGLGQAQIWQATEFCGAILGDVFWLRLRERSAGLGFFASVGTAGFFDVRPSLGASAHLPLGDLLSLRLRAGGLAVLHSQGALPGLSASIELGLRALNYSGRYALTHALVLAWDQAFDSGSPSVDARAGSTVVIALRVDAFWLAAPVGLLF